MYSKEVFNSHDRTCNTKVPWIIKFELTLHLIALVLSYTLPYQWRNKSVSSVARKMYFNIRRISKVKHHLTLARSLCKYHQCNRHIPYWLPQCPLAWHNRSSDAPVTSGSKQRCTLSYKNTLQTTHYASTSITALVACKTTCYIQSTDNHPQITTFLNSTKILCSVYQPHRTMRSSSDQ